MRTTAAKPCPQCGRLMEPRVFASGRPEWPCEFARRVYCSRACLHAANTLPVSPHACENCGKSLERKHRPHGKPEKRVEYDQRRFCSQACRMAVAPGNRRRVVEEEL